MKGNKSISTIILSVLVFSCFFHQLHALVKRKELSWNRLLDGAYIYNVRNHHRTDYPLTINGIQLKRGIDYEFIITDPGTTWFDYSGTTWKLTLRDHIYRRYRYQSCQLKLRLGKTPGFFSPFSREKETIIIIPVIDECPELTKIFYQEFEDVFAPHGPEPINRYTHITVNWEALLTALRRGDLRERIEELPEAFEPEPVREECYKNYWFLKFLKGTHSGESWGFELGEYTLPKSVKAFLEVMGDAFLEIHRSKFSHFKIKEITIKCTGYADYLHYEGSRNVTNLKIFYMAGACPGDFLLDNNDIFVPIGEEDIQNRLTKISYIKDNCTLSAARAYTAMDYLSYYIGKQIEKQGMIRNLNIKYLYRAGGIIKVTRQERNDRNKIEGVPEDRRIGIDITIDAADRKRGL